jgi:hypothetical protein
MSMTPKLVRITNLAWARAADGECSPNGWFPNNGPAYGWCTAAHPQGPCCGHEATWNALRAIVLQGAWNNLHLFWEGGDGTSTDPPRWETKGSGIECADGGYEPSVPIWPCATLYCGGGADPACQIVMRCNGSASAVLFPIVYCDDSPDAPKPGMHYIRFELWVRGQVTYTHSVAGRTSELLFGHRGTGPKRYTNYKLPLFSPPLVDFGVDCGSNLTYPDEAQLRNAVEELGIFSDPTGHEFFAAVNAALMGRSLRGHDWKNDAPGGYDWGCGHYVGVDMRATVEEAVR